MTGSGLTRAFYRLFILSSLEGGPLRAPSLLAALHATDSAWPVEGGAFTKALAQLVESGLVASAPNGAFELTPLGCREREADRAVWRRLLAIVTRLLAGDVPRPEPPGDGGMALPLVRDRVAEDHRERVVAAEIRELARRARDGGAGF